MSNVWWLACAASVVVGIMLIQPATERVKPRLRYHGEEVDYRALWRLYKEKDPDFPQLALGTVLVLLGFIPITAVNLVDVWKYTTGS